MAPVTPPKRNSYIVKTSPISPPEQISKRTRREHFDTASERHCLENSYDDLQADCCSYTFQRTTTYEQSSFQRNLWPASSDVHTNVSLMFDIHGAQRSHMMSTSHRHAHFSQEMSVPFIQAHLTQEMSVSHRHGQFSQQKSISHVQSQPRMSGPLFHMSWPYLQGNVAQQMSMHHVQTNIALQMLVPHVQPHNSQQKTTPYVKRRKSSKQKTVLPSNNKDESKHPVQTNISHQLSVPHVQPHYSQQSSFASEQKKTLTVKRRKSSKQKTVEPLNHKDVSPQTVEPSKHKDVSLQTVEPLKHKDVSPQTVERSKHKDVSPQTVEPSKHKDVFPQTVEPSKHKDVSPQTVEPSKHKDVSLQTVEPSKHKDVSPQTVEPSKHKDVFPQTVELSKHKETVIPTEVEYDKVSVENQCLDFVSKNILQESFNQKDVAIKAQEAQQVQKEANISQMISEPLERSDLNEESLLLEPSLLGCGSEDSSLDVPPELETWCQNMLHDFLNDQKESFHQQNKSDQSQDSHSSSSILQTAECQLVKRQMNEDLTVSQSASQQTDIPQFDQISTLFDPNVPNSNGNKNDNDSAYSSTSPSINSNEDIDWQELYDKILSLN
ncbi:heat shock protein [Biomphalaria pfeifferi]|uniref:Heat shock protein n=1 Tax=Biomphalaria pfeifferi TaxID=112525 RepID=A0AAD8BYQ4_BIOPF|nr:heat shock protein [Biomphalaria pfeifferi]